MTRFLALTALAATPGITAWYAITTILPNTLAAAL